VTETNTTKPMRKVRL